AREWTLRLAASLTGNCRLRRPRPDRTNCRAGMHLDRPPDASASISCPTADPRLSPVILLTYELAAFRPDIVAAIASRCHVTMTIATRPLPERDGRSFSLSALKSTQKDKSPTAIFSENQKMDDRGDDYLNGSRRAARQSVQSTDRL